MGYDLAKGPTVHRRRDDLEPCSLSAFTPREKISPDDLARKY